MMQILYYPVMIEDTSHWSDEKERTVACRTMLSTDDFIAMRNKAGNRQAVPCRVIPGSVKRLNELEMQYRESHIYYQVCKMECETLATVGEGKVWHERYRLTALELALIADNLLTEIRWGIEKPWQIPIGFVMDGANIVLIRSAKAEEWIRVHLGEYYYKNCQLYLNGEKVIETVNN